MTTSKRKIWIFSTILVLTIFVLIGWTVKVQLADSRSFLGQLKEIFFPTKYSANQMQNFQQDLKKSESHAVHNDLGRDYASTRQYDKAIDEYRRAIEIIESDPGEHWTDVSKAEMDRINEDERVFTQKFSRHRLVEVYKKAGRYPEALEQIDWLLAHKPLDHIKQELLTKKNEILQRINSK